MEDNPIEVEENQRSNHYEGSDLNALSLDMIYNRTLKHCLIRLTNFTY